MKIEDLFEGISPVLFHFTRLDQFFGIVNSGSINLSPVHGYENNINKGYKYFLSTTRSRVGSYHVQARTGVLITLDGRRLQQTMKGASTDYWEGTQGAEMEDRVFSNNPSIENIGRFILKVDILIEESQIDNDSLRDQLTQLKNEGYPIYVYDNRQNWISGRPDRARYIIENGRFKVNFKLLMKEKK